MNRKPWVLFLLPVILLAGCGYFGQVSSAEVDYTPTTVPTYTPYPTFTPMPTYTPYPTLTPAATYTPYPTATEIEPTRVYPTYEGDYWPRQALGRENYREIDLQHVWYAKFFDAYNQAVVDKEAWIYDFYTVAMNFFTLPYTDKPFPNLISIIYPSKYRDRVIFTFRERAMDDSIAEVEDRIDLVRDEEGVWKIEWAGWRQRCARGSRDGWTTEPCP